MPKKKPKARKKTPQVKKKKSPEKLVKPKKAAAKKKRTTPAKAKPKKRSPAKKGAKKQTSTVRKQTEATIASNKAAVISTEKTPSNSSAHEHPSRVREERVRQVAYYRWEAAGCPVSDGIEFWLEAERLVRSEG